jgi:hypothetical protein
MSAIRVARGLAALNENAVVWELRGDTVETISGRISRVSPGRNLKKGGGERACTDGDKNGTWSLCLIRPAKASAFPGNGGSKAGPSCLALL